MIKADTLTSLLYKLHVSNESSMSDYHYVISLQRLSLIIIHKLTRLAPICKLSIIPVIIIRCCLTINKENNAAVKTK